MPTVADLDPLPSRAGDAPGSTTMTLVDRYLFEQRELTAVERFSQRHEEADLPLQARYYSALLPAAPPGPGEQYAFEVDLDACSGCKACVAACNSLNGLDETETWRDVGLLHGGNDAEPFLQHVTAACHHCLDPACLNVCPVRAYEKDDLTGIVRHLDDQCIGCQYCILACPYDVPKYNRARGIVRKCDMCSNRLAVGEAPACIQSCPNEAIRITTVRRQEAAENCESGAFLPGAPDPQQTQPTTHYRTNRVFPRNTLPADYYSVRPEHAHWPLALMLVLTQLSVGAFLVGLLLELLPEHQQLQGIRAAHAGGAVLFGLMALAASTLHLGRPHLAFRAVIGLRSSWLSREIVAFGFFALLAILYAGVVRLSDLSEAGSAKLQTALGLAVVGAGLAGIVCSIMIYHCTRRALWNGPATTIRFGLTTLLLGQSTALFTMLAGADFAISASAVGAVRSLTAVLVPGLIVTAACKLLFEASLFAHLRSKQMSPLKRSALLMTGDLARAAKWRFVLGIAGGILLPAICLGRAEPSAVAPLLLHLVIAGQFAALVAGEVLERYLFFTAVVASRMPGGLRT
ncbi:MAG: DmsC/YnfH family molybdoenzyme membrane anchor subunit [Deltaproteobacteria bacterium]